MDMIRRALFKNSIIEEDVKRPPQNAQSIIPSATSVASNSSSSSSSSSSASNTGGAAVSGTGLATKLSSDSAAAGNGDEI